MYTNYCSESQTATLLNGNNYLCYIYYYILSIILLYYYDIHMLHSTKDALMWGANDVAGDDIVLKQRVQTSVGSFPDDFLNPTRTPHAVRQYSIP